MIGRERKGKKTRGALAKASPQRNKPQKGRGGVKEKERKKKIKVLPVYEWTRKKKGYKKLLKGGGDVGDGEEARVFRTWSETETKAQGERG